MERCLWTIIAFALVIVLVQNRRIRKLADIAFFDPLTGAYNRRYIAERMKELSYTREESGLPITIIYIDVDKLKQVNDDARLGHTAGDLYLRKVVKAIKTTVRRSDIVGRLGGDEFIVIMPNTGPEDGESVAEIISGKCSAEIHFDDIGPGSISFGVAARESETQSVDGVMRQAEERMYTQKHAKCCHR
jgi:diguanylate cyclase (GGDEF)-like protein